MPRPFPQLDIPRHPLWLAAYEGAWELWSRAAEPSPDECLSALFARYAHDARLSRWLDALHAEDASPLLAWCEWEFYQASGDAARLTRVLPSLAAQYQWRKAQRRRESGLYWQPRPSDDNSPREPYEWLDVSAQQALAAECVAHIAHAIADDETAATYEAEWRALCALINQHCWDARESFYFDRRADVDLSHVKTAAAWWALAAGVPSAAQAQALAAHLTNPQEFWRVHVCPSLSADHPRYADRGAAWRGSVYPAPNYALVKGLERYGMYDLAFRAADNHLTTVSHVFKETRALWSNYAPDYIEPGSIAQPDTLVAGLAPVTLLVETLLGLRVDAPSRTLHWRPRLAEAYAIEGLHVGEREVALRVRDGIAQIRVSAPLRLHLEGTRGEQWIEVADELRVEVM